MRVYLDGEREMSNCNCGGADCRYCYFQRGEEMSNPLDVTNYKVDGDLVSLSDLFDAYRTLQSLKSETVEEVKSGPSRAGIVLRGDEVLKRTFVKHSTIYEAGEEMTWYWIEEDTLVLIEMLPTDRFLALEKLKVLG